MINKFKIGDRIAVKSGSGFGAGSKGVIVSIGCGAFDYGIRRDNATHKVGYNEWELELLEEKSSEGQLSTEMKTDAKHLFHWRSEALARYGNGHIIVVAESVEAARIKAVSEFEAYVKSPDQYYWFVNGSGEFYDEDDYQEYLALLKTFEEDIAGEPEPNNGAILVRGSE